MHIDRGIVSVLFVSSRLSARLVWPLHATAHSIVRPKSGSDVFPVFLLSSSKVTSIRSLVFIPPSSIIPHLVVRDCHLFTIPSSTGHHPTPLPASSYTTATAPRRPSRFVVSSIQQSTFNCQTSLQRSSTISRFHLQRLQGDPPSLKLKVTHIRPSPYLTTPATRTIISKKLLSVSPTNTSFDPAPTTPSHHVKSLNTFSGSRTTPLPPNSFLHRLEVNVDHASQAPSWSLDDG